MISRPFIQTLCSREIQEGIEWAVSRRKPVLITGEAGIGKTTTVDNIAATDPKANLLVGSSSCGKVKPLLSLIAQLFGIYPSGSAAEIERELWQRLSPDDGYLIIDESQFLEIDALRTVLALNDQTELPIAFVGNPTVLRRTRGRTAAFDQVSDRMRRKIELAGITEADVCSFGAEYNVEGKDAYEFLVQFGTRRSVRALSDLLDDARRRAERGSIRLHHLLDVAECLIGDVARPANRRALA